MVGKVVQGDAVSNVARLFDPVKEENLNIFKSSLFRSIPLFAHLLELLELIHDKRAVRIRRPPLFQVVLVVYYLVECILLVGTSFAKRWHFGQ